MKALDTNVLVRYLTKDNHAQWNVANAYIRKHCTAETPGYINLIVLCEMVWVLVSFYKYEKIHIATLIEGILRTPQLVVQDADSVWEVLSHYTSTNIDFADALIAKINRKTGYSQTATFDKKTAKIEGFELLR